MGGVIRQFLGTRRRFFVALVMLCFGSPVSSAASDPLTTDALRGEALIFARRYDEALVLFQKLAAEYPDSPTGTFGELSVWQTRMFENYDYRFAPQYEETLKRHKPVVDAVMAMRDPPDWDLFVCGASLGMQGFYLVRKDHWLKALGAADRAMGALRKLRWRNPQFVDADLGLGLYEYWRSVFTRQIKLLPFFRDNRAAGIAKVERVAREGQYARDMAQSNLSFLYAEEKRYPEAIAALAPLLQRFPDNIVLRMQRGQVYLAMKDYAKAEAEFRRILAIDQGVTKAEFYLGLSLVKRGQVPSDAQYTAIGRDLTPFDAARQALTNFLTTHPEPEWAAAAHKWLDRIATQRGKAP